MKMILIPKQPHPIVSYMNAGRLLHLSTLLFILESYIYWYFLDQAIQNESLFWTIFWSGFFLFAFTHIFLVCADGWSRFQNYKRAKDQLFIYGFNERIINQYIGSKCQRIAVLTAASELGMEEETKVQFYKMGYRWYHFIPDFMMQDPYFLFRKYFWKRTFLEKYYKPRFDYRSLELATQVK